MDLKWIAQELAVGSWKYLPNLPSKEPPTSTQPEFALQTAMKPIIMWRAGTEQVVTNKAGSVLIPPTPQQYAHDDRGNLVSDGLWSRIWNLENRMTRIESASGVPAQVRKREDWKYLSDGRWIERIISTNNGSAYYPALTNRFVWDGKVLLAVLDHTNGLVMSFMRGSDLSGSIEGAGGVGGVLAVNFAPSTLNPQPSTHLVSYDGNGNVVALTDAATGESTAVYEYGPFGELLRATGPMAKTNPIRWSTQFTDDETDLVSYLYRYYSPIAGRWLSRDPVEERGGLNLYGFVGQNPVCTTDRLGLFRDDWMTCPCRCVSVTVTYSPGGASPPRELALYQNLTDMIFGAKVTVSWSVTGNPRDCEYYQDETGSFSIFNGPGFQKTTKGQNNRMPRAYTDYMGATVPMIPPPPTATYHLQTKWRVMFRCVSSTQDRHVVQRVDSADWDQDFTYP